MDTPEEKQRQLTLKQRKWLKLYLELGNATEAAMRVYDCKDRDSAKQIGYENLTKLDFSDFMEEAGITDNLLQKKIMEGLESTRTISAKVIVKSDDPTIKNKTADARDMDFIDVPDFMARHKYLETALKLKKRLLDKLALTDKDGQSLPIIINAGTGYVPPGVKITQVPEGSVAEQSAEVQSSNLAQKGEKDDNGDNRTV